MIPRIVLGLLQAAGVINPRQIEDRIRHIASAVNGGIDTGNVAPTTKFSIGAVVGTVQGAWQETSALLTLPVTYLELPGTPPFGPPAGTIKEWGFLLGAMSGSSVAWQDQVIIMYRVSADGTTLAEVDRSVPSDLRRLPGELSFEDSKAGWSLRRQASIALAQGEALAFGFVGLWTTFPTPAYQSGYVVVAVDAVVQEGT